MNVDCHRTKYGEAKGNHRFGTDEKLDIAGSKETALVRPSVSLRLVGHVLKVDDGTIRRTLRVHYPVSLRAG